jgi:hypothetical protein
MKYQAVIYNKTITADTFTQIKRLASIEANKRYNIEDCFYLLGLPGVAPLVFRRRNKKAPNNTIMRGAWQ